MGQFTVIRTPAFDLLAKEYGREHSKLESDLEWLLGRLEEAPELMGDHVPELGGVALPIFKTRCKDSCHKIGASGAWRIYYAIHKPEKKNVPAIPAPQKGISKSGSEIPVATDGASDCLRPQAEQ